MRKLDDVDAMNRLARSLGIDWAHIELGAKAAASWVLAERADLLAVRARYRGPLFWEATVGRPSATLLLRSEGPVVSVGRRLRPGDLLLIHAGTEVETYVGGSVDFVEISFSNEEPDWTDVTVTRAPRALARRLVAVVDGEASTEMLRADLRDVHRRSQEYPDAGDTVARHRRTVSHSLSLIRSGWDGAVSDLAREVGVSRSGLYRSFAEILDISPGDWIRIRRLNRLRMRLQEDPSSSIADLAYELGFGHLGNMASSYRRLFDELPRETAARARVA